ncbi:hypothetical protein IIC65_07700, partial [Candidatus Sumerlaeota bacterium]|nr:hypothetical protein [Candidatus Sumerlaeota bacterium]
FEPFPADNPDAADEDTTLVRLLIGEPRTINPFFANSWFDFYFSELLYNGLFLRNEKLKWVPSPNTTVRVEESEDHLVTTVHIRPGMLWQDGHPWTAHDVRFSWEAILDDRVAAIFWKHTAGEIKDVQVIDDTTVRFIHRSASPTANMNMRFPILPKHIYDNPKERANDPTLRLSSYYNRYNRIEVIGSGPYRFVEWKTNDRLIVERWEDYPFEKPHFKRQILKVQPDRNIALLSFKNRELDEIWLTPQQFATQTNGKDFSKLGVKGYGVRRMFAYIGWNMDGSNPFFTDHRVRRALARVYDSSRVLRDVSYNLYTTSTGIFDPDHWAFNPEVRAIEYDVQEAANLLDEAGWRVNEDDGWRYKEIDGRAVKFEFELMLAQSFADAVKMIAIYREDLRKVGIAMTSRILENAAFDERNIKHEFQANVSVWEVSSDPDLWRNHFHSSQHELGRNFVGYKNERVDELFELTRNEFNQKKRAAQFREIQALIYEDQPHLFLWNYSMLHGFNKRLRGVQFSPAGVFLFFPSHRGWWAPREQPSL